jgi:hypothetical protein
LAEHIADIRHIAGDENVVENTLSHPPPCAVALSSTAWQGGKPESSPTSPTGGPAARPVICAVPAFPDMLDFAAIAEHQKSCQLALKASKSSSLQLRAVEVMGASLLCDFSTGVPRPLFPVEDSQKAWPGPCRVEGDTSPHRHQGRVERHELRLSGLGTRLPGLLQGKGNCTASVPVQPIAVLAKWFSHVHLDLVRPLPVAADGSTYLLTMVDQTTRWLEAAPLCSMERPVCADAFIATWVTRFGVPATVMMDRGGNFSKQ